MKPVSCSDTVPIPSPAYHRTRQAGDRLCTWMLSPVEPEATAASLAVATPTWTVEGLGKRTSIERFFGRIFSLFGYFRLQRPPLCGWSAAASPVALTYAATTVVALAAQHSGRPDLIRSPKQMLPHCCEGLWAL